MNCRPGDLARIVGVDPRLKLNDRFVKLADQPSFIFMGVPHWRLEQEIAMRLEVSGFSALTGEMWFKGQHVVLCEVPDCNLRPIRPQPDEAVDEIVDLVGAAPKTLTEVREATS